ncbi:MAG: helix-turn-helix transcriptional regulator [Clostridium sp.]|nr:helix-turn-helix transcriptional regulator [Clostridium sp.]
MKLYKFIEEITGQLKRKVSYTDIAAALDVSRQYANQIKNKELTQKQLQKLNEYFKCNFNIDLANAKRQTAPAVTDDCISIPVLGGVAASMGYGVTVYNEEQTASYSISKKLANDLDINPRRTEMIFAQGDSMLPTIEGGDSLLIDHSRREIYDGKIYCVRIEGQLYAKRLQKIPPNTIRVVSDNDKYRSFEIDLSQEINFDFAVIGEVRWWGRVAR